MDKPKHTVLIVEDEPNLIDVLRDEFVAAGFNVIEAHNGITALETALQKKPDIMLLDIVMPMLDGIAVLKKLRTDSWGATVPILMLSNLCDSRTVMESIQNGATDYLIKTDWKMEDVIAKVRNVLKSEKQ